jgi:hypothetical protein
VTTISLRPIDAGHEQSTIVDGVTPFARHRDAKSGATSKKKRKKKCVGQEVFLITG